MRKWIVGGLLRAALAFAGGAAAMTDEQIGAAVRAIIESLASGDGLVISVALGLGASLWSIFDKRRKAALTEPKPEPQLTVQP